MVRYKPYERYKDSGVEWIGEIPEHWKIGRFKHSVEGCIGGVWGEEPGDDENDIVCVRVADFDRVKLTVNEENLTFRSIPLSQRKRRELNEGDLLIEKSGGGDQQPVGTVVINTIKLPAVCSNFIGRMPVSNRYSPYFLSYLHSAAHSIRLNVKSIKQTTGIQNLDIASYLNEKVAFPPLKEQQAIANSLDHKTSEIDNLIADKEKLITLLQEYRQSVISEAVTKGLNPDVKMKDSGIEWIGEIPEHWEVTPLFTTLLKRKTINKGLTESNVLSLSYGRIITRDVSTNTGLLPESFETYQIVEPNNLVLRLTDLQNDWTSLRCGLVTQKGIITSAYLALTPLDAIMPEYAYYLLHAYDLLKVFYGMGGGVRQSLNFVDLKWMPLLLPPIEEQHSIIKHLNSKLQLINQTIQSLADANVQLKTYRQSLISEVVTGKIDVREFEVKGVDTSA
ncbi:MAG TPA: restriction endonuclease subunit S [Bacillota bacterium]|nr:restriction endonuclease subunit S [Bacillota bacterium]HQD20120.1 restriction endonuclease subunit S [Bacillota bacterium]